MNVTFTFGGHAMGNRDTSAVKSNVVRTNVYHKYIKDLKLNITIDLDGFIY